MGQMRALLSRVTGGPERLEIGTVLMPEPGRGEIRIRVAACGINFPDALIIEDRYQFKPERPFAPGTEVSGVVDAVGPGAQRKKVGEENYQALIALSDKMRAHFEADPEDKTEDSIKGRNCIIEMEEILKASSRRKAR